jgi:hypothetical protein
MENAPVIHLVGFELPTDPEARQRVRNWVENAHRPLMKKSPWWIEASGYKSISENKEYPDSLRIWHYASLGAYEKNMTDPNWRMAADDQNLLRAKYGQHTMWSGLYELKMSFRNGAVFTPAGKENTAANSAPIIYLSASNVSPFIKDKYEEWFSHWGYDIFLPLFMKLTGITGYDLYKFIQIHNKSTTSPLLANDYPAFISMLYFENLNAVDNYKKSRELAAFQKVMQADFSGALNTNWDVAYELESIFKREA